MTVKINLSAGKYILAVSGGVDSMVLLDLLSSLPGVELVVAHFEHGIRPDSSKDGEFVSQAAAKYGLKYEVSFGRLGSDSSEDKARQARYDFLRSLVSKHGADAIVTAHHQDDLIETALINLLRGTGRRGLYSISANPGVIRPLLGHSKQEIIAYARQNAIEWKEDPTNSQEVYLRNYVRKNIMPNLSDNQRGQIIGNSDKVAEIDTIIQREIVDIEKSVFDKDELDRSLFSALPSEIGSELLIRRFREMGIADIDRKTINRINANIRTGGHNRSHPVKDGVKLELTYKTARFSR